MMTEQKSLIAIDNGRRSFASYEKSPKPKFDVRHVTEAKKTRTNTTATENTAIDIIAELVEFSDIVTGGHITRTQKYLTLLIAKLLEYDIYREDSASWDLDSLILSAQLHDVGKITISGLILKKPSSLTEDEFEIMKTHVQAGVNVISNLETNETNAKFIEYAKIIAGTHHEKWNGTGYPHGLVGTGIPLEGRLMAIADVYDALVSARAYKEPFSPTTAAQIIRDGKGTCFDPMLIEVFDMLNEEFAKISRII